MLDQKKRFNVAKCGRRTGKTELGKLQAAEIALAGYPVAYCEPTYDMLEEVFQDLVDKLEPHITRRDYGQRLELDTGGVIDFWSFHNGADRIRGRKYKRLVLDECAIVIGFKRIWEKVLRPTLLDYEGDAWFLSTPRRGSGFNELYEYALEGTDSEWECWQFTPYDNPHISDTEIDKMKATMSIATFAVEVMADDEYTESELVYPGFSRVHHLRRGEMLKQPMAWANCKVRVVGIDPGGTDYTAIVPMGISNSDHFHVFGEYYKPDTDIDYYIRALEQISQAGSIHGVAVGETGGMTIINTLRTAGYNAFKPRMQRFEGIDYLRMLFEKQRLTIDPECVETVSQIATYKKKFTTDADTGDKYATKTPSDHHADLPDALRYAVMGYVKGDILRPHGGQVTINHDSSIGRTRDTRPGVVQKLFPGESKKKTRWLAGSGR